jgi:hypothetical protein
MSKNGFVVMAPCLTLLAMSARFGSMAQEDKKSEIPLSQIFSTSIQQETQPFAKIGKTEYELMGKVKSDSERIGASNAYLAYGDTFREVLGATMLPFSGGVSATRPVRQSDQKSRNAWFIAYFGIAGSSPARWEITSVQRREKSVRVSYRENRGGGTDDVRPYYFWIPIGEITDGSFLLELFDEKSGESLLIRRVEISRP